MLLFAKCITSPLSLLHLCPFRLHFEEFERKMRDLTVSWMLPAWGLKACSVDSVNPHQEVGHMFLLELKLFPVFPFASNCRPYRPKPTAPVPFVAPVGAGSVAFRWLCHDVLPQWRGR